MTHLRIEQNNGTIEEVSSAVIDKLYDIVSSGNLDQNSNLIGRLHTTATYQDYIDYLEDAFKVNGTKLLIIDATKKYISFTDPEVASYWANSTYGDGTGIDSTSAASVLLIPANAFKNNTSIEYFNELGRCFPNCTAIKTNSFQNCSALKSIDLSNIDTIENCAFADCTNLASVNSGVLNIPLLSSFGGSGHSAHFIRCTNLIEVNIGSLVQDSNKITRLYTTDFYGCTNLEKVTGLNKINAIERGAFTGCTKLESLDFSSELTILDRESFYLCSSLLCIDLSNVTETGSGCFKSCTNLVDLSTNNPTQINTGVATYTFNWTTVPSEVFSGCKLTNKSFIFPNATSINDKAFLNTEIVAISAPNAVNIGQKSFTGCTGLTSIIINSSILTTIGDDAFSGCTNLVIDNLSLPNLTSLGSTVFEGVKILLISNLGSVITQLPNLCFNKNPQLTSINIPSQVTTIGEYCFRLCTGLTSIDLSHIATIKNYAFKDCSNLTTVKLGSNLTTVGIDAFANCNSLTTIQVPSAKLSDYQTLMPSLASKMITY